VQKSERKRFNEEFDPRFEQTRAEILAEGATERQARTTIEAMILELAKATVATGVEEARDSAERLLKQVRDLDTSDRARVRSVWGEHLDRLALIRLRCTEWSGDYYTDMTSTGETVSDLLNALGRLSALGMRILGEIWTLLEAGYPSAATARCRTLHEITVTAWVLAEKDGMPGLEDLALRYLRHGERTHYPEAKADFDAAEQGDLDPFSVEELETLRLSHRALLKDFGSTFNTEWGWAMPLFPKADDCKFTNLEALVEMSSFRPGYVAASHLVHGGSRGMLDNFEKSGDEDDLTLVTGASTNNFTLPIIWAAQDAVSLTAALVFGADMSRATPADVVFVLTTQELVANVIGALPE
jgi:hypothetical protein